MVNDNIKLDRMRYVKDNVPSMFAILAIVFDVLYFVLIYKINNEYFYTSMIGVSVVANLLFMLFGFWSSIFSAIFFVKKIKNHGVMSCFYFSSI